MDQIRAGDWRRANIAAEPGGQVALDFVTWHRLRRGGEATFAEYLDFIGRNPDWPGLDLLRVRAETAIPTTAAPETVLEFFESRIPETSTGLLRLIDAHRTLGHTGDAEALAVLAWRTMTLTTEAEAQLLASYGEILGSHHVSRLDDLLWRGEVSAARRMYSRVPDGWEALAEARIALSQQSPGVDTLIEKVPDGLADDAGLAYERFNWRAAKGRNEDAVALMDERSSSLEGLGRPQYWASWRRIFARQTMRAGNYADAYTLASQNFLVDGSDYADLEWLSGFIALRFLNDPELAVYHFTRFDAAVQTPISKGRGHYWLGRAYSAAGNEEAAQAAYEAGAEHQTSFYGLLSAEAAGLSLDPTLTGAETFPALEASPLKDSSVLAAGLMLLDAGIDYEAERFLTHLVEELDRDAAGTLGTLLLERGEEHVALMVAKRAASVGTVIPAAYFPMSDMLDRDDLPVERALALSIARRESEFDPVVVSPAGARGLMQLMPGTAQDVANELGLPYDRDGLTDRPDYNATLGSAYLAGLIEVFGPAPVLVSVGYNAGPGRAVDWVGDRGDPRSAGIDIIDWIEMIPFRETQNYVMRVTESLRIYRARLTGTAGPVAFTDLLREG
ncbi:lytic transglycosylase domain-containing protein [Tropicimonas sp. IMCC34011]|uniref:lytic transglycosylase domain-containing protein n=1 Tax=Tropicimonas sp. IMCC34011 TaxID=2248759 RepID=UPI000E261577|nr:lytic transglycosylase domain-containing protein [Tropicimonas sp. IMCC34011]